MHFYLENTPWILDKTSWTFYMNDCLLTLVLGLSMARYLSLTVSACSSAWYATLSSSYKYYYYQINAFEKRIEIQKRSHPRLPAIWMFTKYIICYFDLSWPRRCESESPFGTYGMFVLTAFSSSRSGDKLIFTKMWIPRNRVKFVSVVWWVLVWSGQRRPGPSQLSTAGGAGHSTGCALPSDSEADNLNSDCAKCVECWILFCVNNNRLVFMTTQFWLIWWIAVAVYWLATCPPNKNYV